jgi:hypothetical protein
MAIGQEEQIPVLGTRLPSSRKAREVSTVYTHNGLACHLDSGASSLFATIVLGQ